MNYGILPTLTKDYILSKISQEAIFEKYLGIQVELDVPLKSPPVIRSIDNNPTCQFYMTSNGKLKFRDMAGYFWGDCFDAVAHVSRLNSNNKKDFNAILEIIARDFRIHKYEGKLEISTGNTYDPRDVKGKKEKTKIEFKVKVRNWIELDARFKNSGILSIDRSDLGEQLPKIIKDNLDFFAELQIFHDCDVFWTEDGLSEAGEKRLFGIKCDYITKIWP